MDAGGARRPPPVDRRHARVRRHLGLHEPDRATVEEGKGRRRGDERRPRLRVHRSPVGGVRLRGRGDQVGRRRNAPPVHGRRASGQSLSRGGRDATDDAVDRASQDLGRAGDPPDVRRHSHGHLRLLLRREAPPGAGDRGTRRRRDGRRGVVGRRRRDRDHAHDGCNARAVARRGSARRLLSAGRRAGPGGRPGAQCRRRRRHRSRALRARRHLEPSGRGRRRGRASSPHDRLPPLCGCLRAHRHGGRRRRVRRPGADPRHGGGNRTRAQGRVLRHGHRRGRREDHARIGRADEQRPRRGAHDAVVAGDRRLAVAARSCISGSTAVASSPPISARRTGGPIRSRETLPTSRRA